MRNSKATKPKAERTMIKNIVKNLPTATAWIFSFLFEMGTATIDIFLSPSYYGYHGSQGGLIDFSGLEKKNRKKKKIKAVTIRQSIRRLKKQGFVEEKGGKFFLTEKGKILGQKIAGIKNSVNKKWDGKFRVVIFDIPEKKSDDRFWLRQELYMLEYKLLQKSVFIGKHPLPKELIKSIKKRGIGNSVNYILAEKIYKNIV